MSPALGHVSGYVCTRCGRAYDTSQARLTCPVCGLEGILDVLYDYEAVRAELTREILAGAPRSHWRYRPLLPLPPGAVLPAAPVGLGA